MVDIANSFTSGYCWYLTTLMVNPTTVVVNRTMIGYNSYNQGYNKLFTQVRIFILFFKLYRYIIHVAFVFYFLLKFSLFMLDLLFVCVYFPFWYYNIVRYHWENVAFYKFTIINLLFWFRKLLVMENTFLSAHYRHVYAFN